LIVRDSIWNQMMELARYGVGRLYCSSVPKSAANKKAS
jgi:hypothetical protein